MHPVKAITQIATVARGISGASLGRNRALAEVQYPANGLAPKFPGLVLFLDPTTIRYMSTEQYWDFTVRGLLMAGLVNETSKIVADIDPLFPLLVDAFAPTTEAFHLRMADGDQVDTCAVTAIEPSQEIGYAGQTHYGAIVTWSIEMRRYING